ncbi:class I SAM-dependent methyltransferase [Maliponia aquimaris]|uniref:Malonyl-[acyl-carrier protein] O-methyltransferase n=1 Tax=Maliponia aquimaris TaxID=1673631 RepID=A0A238L0V0_9RHOB|nr:class I SAM-dependent methyltransferase [Maliponia aquimaris]SMX48715.1 Malonyl-[acyl-carrier protein] O-methyltransferase [Maliponia aquimaris]
MTADDTDNGWDASAAAWVAHLGDTGDRGREHVLDAPMLAAARASGARIALDVGCGEGRFCRMLRAEGIEATGLDPTAALLDIARARDPQGAYLQGIAEALPFADAQFDLVVAYLSLIDIADYRTAIAQMARVLTPGGTLLVGNLNPFATAVPRDWPEGKGGWVWQEGRRRYYAFDDYMTERGYKTAWAGIRITNYHRPLSAYMAAFLGAGLRLRAYDEPPYTGPDPGDADKFARAPWFNLMVWERR